MADKAFKMMIDMDGLNKLENVNLKNALAIDSMVERMLNVVGYTVQADAAEMIQQGPSRTGEEYTVNGKRSRRSADGEPAKTDTGTLASSLFLQMLGSDEAEVGYLEAIAPYGKYLEDEDALNRQVLEPALMQNRAFIEAQKNKLGRDIVNLVTAS
jgi:hypothetical protein